MKVKMMRKWYFGRVGFVSEKRVYSSEFSREVVTWIFAGLMLSSM